MTPQFAVHIISQALLAAFWICAPLLAISFALGILVNLVQIATSLQDPVFSTIPRLAVALGAFLLLLPGCSVKRPPSPLPFWAICITMRGELTLSASTLIAFLLVLARTSGAFIFTPMPDKSAGPSAPRILFALACALALFPKWPQVDASSATLGRMCLWLLAELALGVAIGLLVSLLAEALTFGAQVLGLQAGYAYASIVDPTTQADSETLAV